jgi:UDP:flavonoid glycosyltransferase YjiC (YdhE family)
MTARIVLATFGSLGDVNPYIGLALGLQARGHEPVVATSEYYRTAVEGAGVEFHPVRPDFDPTDREVVGRIMDPARGSEFILRDLVIPRIRESHADVRVATRGAGMIVTHPIAFAGQLVAEERRLPWISTVLAPMSFFSVHDVPVFPAAPRLRAAPRIGAAAGALLVRFAKLATRGWTRPIGQLRDDLGLPVAPNPIFEGQHSPELVLALFSAVLADPQPDWPAHTWITGHVFYDGAGGDARLPPELAAFLDAGPPPVVFTLGTSAVGAPGRFYEQSVPAARRLGVRAVILVGADPRNRPAEPLPADVMVCAHAPYSALFPRAAAVVHQGGIGTVAQTLRAGRPMLVVPHAHDQPDNAARVERLGVARTLYPRHYTAERAAAELRALLDDSEVRRRGAVIAARVRSEDGVTAACDAIETRIATPAWWARGRRSAVP